MFNLDKKYDRLEFLHFLQSEFLPEDFQPMTYDVSLDFKSQYAKEVVCLGKCPSLGLEVFEIRHDSSNDPRVGMSRDAFKLLLHTSFCNKALVAFIPSNDEQYRFSLIQIEAYQDDKTSRISRSYSNPRRYSFLLGVGAHTNTPREFLQKKGRIRGEDAGEELLKRFSVEVLTKQFYQELFNWYEWALSEEIGVKYPNNNLNTNNNNSENIEEHIIRLITRLMFVWFIKQKKLIPDVFFDENYLKLELLKDFDPFSSSDGKYYNAVLQNLFFATLNKEIAQRAFTNDDVFMGANKHYGIKTYFRDDKEFTWFTIEKDEVIKLFSTVPFLNGGLFECLDKDITNSRGRTSIVYYDGFSRSKEKQAYLPNCLFFEKEKGIIPLLDKYNFTIEENTPMDVQIALDPELLGQVFENLLGAFNSETKITVRKQSGAFYTPREIVSYMVDESLCAYICNQCPEISKESIRLLFISEQRPKTLTSEQSSTIIKKLKGAKIIDPACGSGAFPMGILNRMVELLQKLDDVDSKTPYDLKLHLIENCIFGVDIQPIAIQISKLRFFISLVCEQETTTEAQDNYGIKPLPNLETKFVVANTLMGLKRENEQKNLFEGREIQVTRDKLWGIRHKHFSAKNSAEKKKYRETDKLLRLELSELIENTCGYEKTYAEHIAHWDPYSQNTSSAFFDPEWMFGLQKSGQDALLDNGGYFDIVIGNPPYGAKISDKDKKILKLNYKTAKTHPGVQKGSMDSYSLFIEAGYNLLNNNGNLSFIVPISITSSDSLSGVHKLLEKNCTTIRISSYAVRPQPIFLSAFVNTSILQFHKTSTQCSAIYSTKMYRKGRNFNLQTLLGNLHFVEVKDFKLFGRIPKIGTEIEKDILSKLFRQVPISHLVQQSGKPIYYRAAGGRYFKVVTPYSTKSSAEKFIYFKENIADSIGCVLSSNLSFWFYQIYSDNLNWKSYELESFTIPVEKFNCAIIRSINNLYAEYLYHIEQHANIRKSSGNSSYHVSQFKEYKIGKSKHIIDRIDDFICPLYGLTHEEIEFIKNYELEFRLSEE